MTEDYKKTLFSYLKGNLILDTGTSDEIFKEINEIPVDNWPNDGKILPNGWNKFRYEGMLEVSDSDLLVLYGGYKVYQSDEVRGIITILTNNFVPIKSFFQYDSGTNLRYIHCMNQSEDGTFYIVDGPDFPHDRNWSFTTSQKRFVMLNNFSQQINGEYTLSLQKSYNFPSSYNNFFCRKMFKDINSSRYILIGNQLRDQNSPDFDAVRIIDLTVNVGSSNEWNKIDDNGDGWLMGDSYVEFQGDDYFLEILLVSTLATSRTIFNWKKDFNDERPSTESIISFPFSPRIDSSGYQNQSVFLNKNDVYFVQNNQRWGTPGVSRPKYIGLYYCNLSTKQSKTFYEKYLGDYDFCNIEAIYITENNGDIYIEFNNNFDSSNGLADYYFQRLENNWNPIKISEQQFFRRDWRALYVKNNYNLVNWFSYMANPHTTFWKQYNIKEIYNSSNYNGSAYINTNSLISHSGELYSNDNLVFARNLYNKTISENTTVSTIEVPNNYLNGIDITQKNLLSETNLNLIQDNNTIQKNVYETLFINFINTLIISDQNNSSKIINSSASTYLNSSINDSTKYDSAKFYNKGILTYQDGSTKEINYEFQDINDTSTNILFGVYVDKLINKLEIVSNDKTMVYQTIDLTELEINKIYNIKQKLEVV